MAASEKRIQLKSGILAIVSTQDDLAYIDLCTMPETQGVRGFDTKGFVLKYGLEEHRHFHFLLKQFDATISLGVDRQSYCFKADRTDDFLNAVNLLICEYFSYARTRSEAPS